MYFSSSVWLLSFSMGIAEINVFTSPENLFDSVHAIPSVDSYTLLSSVANIIFSKGNMELGRVANPVAFCKLQLDK